MVMTSLNKRKGRGKRTECTLKVFLKDSFSLIAH